MEFICVQSVMKMEIEICFPSRGWNLILRIICKNNNRTVTAFQKLVIFVVTLRECFCWHYQHNSNSIAKQTLSTVSVLILSPRLPYLASTQKLLWKKGSTHCFIASKSLDGLNGKENAVTIGTCSNTKTSNDANFRSQKIIQLFTFLILWKTFVVMFIICMFPSPWCHRVPKNFNRDKSMAYKCHSLHLQRKKKRKPHSSTPMNCERGKNTIWLCHTKWTTIQASQMEH